MKKWIVISISIIILAVAGYFGYQYATDSGSSVPIATAPVPPPMNESTSTEDLVVQKKWNPGEKVVMEITTVSEADMQLPKEPKPIHTRSEIKQQISLCELSTSPEGGHVFEFCFEEMAVNVNAGKGNVIYSSKDSPSNDPKNPFPAIFNALVNHKIIFSADKDMKVTSVTGLEELAADMGNNIKSHEMKSMFGMDNASYYNNMLNGFFMDASTYSIKIGESWNTQKSTEVPNLGVMNSNITHTFSGWKDYNGTKAALVNFTGKITISGTMNDKKSGFGMSMKDSSISGYSFIDPLTGQSLEYSMNLNSNMEMKIPQRTPKGTTEMNMSMLMKQNTSGKVISRTKTIEPAISISVAAPDSTQNTTLSTDTK